MTYYNTTHEAGIQLKLSVSKAETQEKEVLEFFRQKKMPLTPLMVYRSMRRKDNDILITSVRRAINTLTKNGFLIKTDVKIYEQYGKANYCWKLKDSVSND